MGFVVRCPAQNRLTRWKMTLRTRPLRLIAPIAAVMAMALLAACGGSSNDSSSSSGGGSVGSGSTKLTLVAYSTPEEAYKELIPAFEKTSAGKGVGFSTSY